MTRVLLIAAFAAAQFAPALHGFHSEEEFAEHCTDGAQTTHWCACTLDHDAPDCVVCAHVAQGAVLVAATASAPAQLDDLHVTFTPDVPCSSWLDLSAPPRGPPAAPRT
jgi:hypothetical protein